jgi:uncharacterized protein YbjQ (UPF0145 family)
MVWGQKRVFDADKAIESHQNVMADCVNDAIDDMEARARDKGADAIIGMQISSIRGSEVHLGDVGAQITEAVITMYVCGTAVRIRRLATIATAKRDDT